jgi:hypothetical protein
VQGSKIGEVEIIAKIPALCLDADHARRLRNIIVHNQGCINDKYANNFSKINEIFDNQDFQPIYNQAIEDYRKNQAARIPVIITHNDYCQSLIHHLRLLHFLHNEIQLQYFNCTEGYDYRKLGKPIVWHRVFFGV